MDWKNRLDMIKNKVKTQLNAKGVDNLLQLQYVFNVSILLFYKVKFVPNAINGWHTNLM